MYLIKLVDKIFFSQQTKHTLNSAIVLREKLYYIQGLSINLIPYIPLMRPSIFLQNRQQIHSQVSHCMIKIFRTGALYDVRLFCLPYRRQVPHPHEILSTQEYFRASCAQAITQKFKKCLSTSDYCPSIARIFPGIRARCSRSHCQGMRKSAALLSQTDKQHSTLIKKCAKFLSMHVRRLRQSVFCLNDGMCRQQSRSKPAARPFCVIPGREKKGMLMLDMGGQWSQKAEMYLRRCLLSFLSSSLPKPSSLHVDITSLGYIFPSYLDVYPFKNPLVLEDIFL